MDFELTQRQELRPLPRIVPEQIFAGRLLQMPLAELEAFLRTELSENPALVMEEPEPEVVDDPLEDDDWEPSLANEGGEDYDPFRTVAAAVSLVEDLETQYRTQFPPESWPVGLDIIESLDEDGYYRDDMLEAADRHGLSVPEFEVFLRQVQSLEPAGIAARDVRECLSLQAGRAADAPALARRILEPDAWPHLARRDVEKLAALSGETVDAVSAAVEWIRERLQPYPAENTHEPWESLAPRRSPLQRPDVVIRFTSEGLWIDCPGLCSANLSVDPYYERLYGAIRRARGLALSKDERHIADFVDRARLVAHAVDLRARTLYRIARAVAERQIEMLRRGPSAARPLTQKQIAASLGLHESTVCRATQGKLVQLPQGETVTFDVFFDAALPVRDLVEEIIGHEDPRHPLKDGQIAEELARRGVSVARRTVAKYRDQLHILPCDLRKEHGTAASTVAPPKDGRNDAPLSIMKVAKQS